MKTKRVLEHKKYLCNVTKALLTERMVFYDAKRYESIAHRKNGILRCQTLRKHCSPKEWYSTMPNVTKALLTERMVFYDAKRYESIAHRKMEWFTDKHSTNDNLGKQMCVSYIKP